MNENRDNDTDDKKGGQGQRGGQQGGGQQQQGGRRGGGQDNRQGSQR